jgi:hypothetical protein
MFIVRARAGRSETTVTVVPSLYPESEPGGVRLEICQDGELQAVELTAAEAHLLAGELARTAERPRGEWW